MNQEERNFRSIYYEKVGFKSVEEKKSLEILLKDKSLDLIKLKQFCVRFSVPQTYRCLLWKLLLGILPTKVQCHEFVTSQRKQEFNNLLQALVFMKIVDERTPKSQVFLVMWLLQTNNLTFDYSNLQERDLFGFVPIAKCLNYFFDDDTDIYWIAKKFYEKIAKMKNDIPRLIEVTHCLIEKEDAEYYKILKNNGIIDGLPLSKWFQCCLAGIIDENCIIKIWDKICGGSHKILAFLVTITLLSLKHRIIKMNNASGVIDILKNIPEDSAEIIVNKTIDLWQHYGSPLTVHEKPKSIFDASFK
ncbi:unnamed protein product [Ceutorhynchus assimilis]|uniref:TBC1 domain family member 7 n=1 Tax=Ceutorhynchus assimilis TaxID=467358 RepID=A0A9N9QIK8_9CUCU|nr:unnamed protein product [Ceutorhynchus assimilis]